MAYLDTQIVSASIQEIGGGLSASSDELSWIQPSYLIAEIIVIQGFFGGSMIPTAFTAAVVSRQTKGRRSVFRQCRWRSCADARSSRRRLAYRWLVMALVVLGMLVTLLVPMLVRVDEPDLTFLRGADYLRMILMALCLGCLDYVLEEGAHWDWFADDSLKICAEISGLPGIGFIIRCLT